MTSRRFSSILLLAAFLSALAAPQAIAKNTEPMVSVNNAGAIFSAAASLTTGRSSHTASVLTNGKVLVTGGGLQHRS